MNLSRTINPTLTLPTDEEVDQYAREITARAISVGRAEGIGAEQSQMRALTARVAMLELTVERLLAVPVEVLDPVGFVLSAVAEVKALPPDPDPAETTPKRKAAK